MIIQNINGVTTMSKRIPYGVASYEQIVQDNYYFVDKTGFIRELEGWNNPMFLRPRRFGKSLFCSILECYYDIARKEQFDFLFGDTDIGSNPTPLRNAFTVMRFSFSSVASTGSFEDIHTSFDNVCSSYIWQFAYKYADVLRFPDEKLKGHAEDVLNDVLNAVKNAGLPPVYIIIDEYDNFTNRLLTEFKDDVYKKMTSGDAFFKTFFRNIKDAIGDRRVANCFITGVLPVTMDDLTSGFNIAKSISLKEKFLNMAGFTRSEVEALVDAIFRDYNLPGEWRARVLDDLDSNYDGYCFLPEAGQKLYNSAICNNYLQDLANEGKIPKSKFDPNLRVSGSWLNRLAGSREDARKLMEKLVYDGNVIVDEDALQDRFTADIFLTPKMFTTSLYYLGLLTWDGTERLRIPNQNVKIMMLEYYQTLSNFTENEDVMYDTFRQFWRDRDLGKAFQSFWDNYICLIPAQAFDKANENFFRSMFFLIAHRHIPRSMDVNIEQNTHSGRYDLRFLGALDSPWKDYEMLVEFKHFSVDGAKEAGIDSWTTPPQGDIDQVNQYAMEQLRIYPDATFSKHLIYTIGGKTFRHFEV